ncbi:MAG: exo-alpha-sialidase [Candidatus Omnitrophica bacterium]|nr:exo-alpha-sialidase [Candidatus Omnitrophota bacterium]
MKRHFFVSVFTFGFFISAVSGGASQRTNAVQWAKPLAQDSVTVHQVREHGDPDKWICVGSPDLTRLPNGRLIASMELWLQMPGNGIEGGIDYPNHCLIKASDDDGKTWKQISTTSVTWGSLFTVNEALYLIGNNPHTRSIIIVRSVDGGQTWSEEVALFDDSKYHGAPTPVLIKNGFAYRAFEDTNRPFSSLVVAGDLSKDLLDPASWRMSNKVSASQNVEALMRGPLDKPVEWIEGNIIEVKNEMLVLLRTGIGLERVTGIAGVCQLTDDGENLNYRFLQYHAMPGGQNKFDIVYDPLTDFHWSCVVIVPDSYQDPEPLAAKGFKGPPGNMRRILMLVYSRDALNWFQAGCVAMSKNPMESFHYSSQLIDGDDLLVLSRTSLGGELPYNNHDSNQITLHRVKDFRRLALDLTPDFSFRANEAPMGED